MRKVLKIKEVAKAFKGDTEVVGEKLEKMQKGFEARGYIKMRAFERILFNTDADNGKFTSPIIDGSNDIVINKGIQIVKSHLSSFGVVQVLLYNSSPFLTTIKKDEIVGDLVLN